MTSEDVLRKMRQESPHFTNDIVKQRLAYDGHVLRDVSGLNALLLLEKKFEVKKVKGRPRWTWIDDLLQWAQKNTSYGYKTDIGHEDMEKGYTPNLLNRRWQLKERMTKTCPLIAQSSLAKPMRLTILFIYTVNRCKLLLYINFASAVVRNCSQETFGD